MTNNFKPGDLAIIVNARVRHELIGCVVELHQRIAPNERYKAPGETAHNRNTSDNHSWVCLGECFNFAEGSEFGGNGWAQVSEKHLMPLRGDFAPEQAKSREVPA